MKFVTENMKHSQLTALLLLVGASVACYIPNCHFFVFALLGIVLIQNRKNIDVKQITASPFSWLLCYVIWGYVSILYSDNARFATHQIEKSIPLLLLSIVAFLYKKKGPISFVNIQKIYFLVSLIILTILSLLLLYNFVDGNLIRYGDSLFSSQIDAFLFVNHRTYFSVSLMMIFPFLYKQISGGTTPLRLKILYGLSALVIFIFIFLAGSRSALLTIATLIGFYAFVEVKKRFGKIMMLLPFVLLLILVAVFFKTPRIERALHMTSQGYSFEQTFTRIGIWESSLKLIEANPFFGVGIGDYEDALALQYKEDSKDFLGERQFNCHNQYLQILVERGIVGGLSFLAFVIALVYYSDRRKTIYTWSFIIVYASSFLFESMLNRNIGVLPFVFWIFILFVYDNETEKIESKMSRREPWIILFFLTSSFVWLISFSIGKPFDSENPNTYLTTEFDYVEHDNLPEVNKLTIGGDGALFDANNIVLRKHPDGPFMSSNIKRISLLDLGNDRDSVIFSCWCYVSEDANIKHAGIYAYEPPHIYEDMMFDLSSRGVWQKLSVSSAILERGVDFGLNISLFDNNEMEGSVVFLCPDFLIE